MHRAEQRRRERRASRWFEPGYRGRLRTWALLMLVSHASLGPLAVGSQAWAATPLAVAASVAAVPPTLLGAVSRKVHGVAGTFDLALSQNASTPTVEPRQEEAATIVFTFDKPVTTANAAVTEGIATAELPAISGNTVAVALTGVTNAQWVTETLTDVASADGGAGGEAAVRIGFLLGDANQNGVVTVSDLAQVNTQIAQAVGADNFLRDVNANGTLTVADKGIANTQITEAVVALGSAAPTVTVWVNDAVPAGATTAGTNEGWSWVSANPTPYAGTLAHQSVLVSGYHQHYFDAATATLAVGVGDTLFTYVYLDPVNPPSEVMLQWNDGTWEHRAYWGANLIALGTDGTASRRYMGPLPAAGQWVRLEVPAAQVGLEGRVLDGMAFTLHDGRATWDYAGTTAGSPLPPAPTTTTLASSLNPSTAGTNVTFTATVVGTSPTGTVAFTDDGAAISGCGAVALSGSGNTRTAGCSTASLPAGTHNIVATYSGNATNAGSASAPLAQVVNAASAPTPTTTTLASSLNPSTAGTNVTFTATVVGTSPTGTVAFTDDGAAISGCGAVALSGSGNTRTAGCSTASLPAGTHNIVATYSGNATNAGSASAPLAQVVNATSTVTVWVNDAVPAGATTAGTNEGWSWVSANPTPYAGTLAHQSVLVSGYHQHYFDAATATLAVGVGDTLFTYVYLDPVNPPSEVMLQWNDGTWEHRAYWGANLIALGTDGTASRRYMGPLPAAGQWVRLEVPAAQVGLEGRVLDGMAFTLHDGRATWDYAGTTAGSPLPPAPTTTTLASSLNPSTAGTNVTFTATVVGTSPTGTVAFTDDGAAISGCGAVALSGSGNTRTAGCSTASLPAGTHNIVATYSGNATNAGSASAPLAQVVNAASAPTPTTTTLASSLNPSTAGTNVTFTATVVGTSPTGTVAFTDDGAAISGCGAVALSGSGNTRTAGCSTASLPAGTHNIVATYSGNATNAGSASAPLAQVVNATSTVTVWVNDAVPAGATTAGTNEGWSWVSANPTPYAGTLAHQSVLVSGYHQHYFDAATATLAVGVGDTLFTYVYLDPVNPPSEVMLQWNDGTWEHRAYWGANLIALGTDGTASRRYMGPLPAAGQWVRLEVPAAQVGLEGRVLDGMAFTLHDGRATWDYAGTTAGSPLPPAPTTTTLASSLNPSTAGTNVTFTATVVGTSPTGTVAFTDDGAAISGCGAVALSGSGNTRTAGCSTASLPAGTHNIVATYSGNATNAGSASAPLAQVVNAASAPTPTTTTLASSLNPSTAGTNVTFTATVVGTSPTGTVAFTDDGAAISGCGAVALSGSGNTRTAGCSTASLPAGTHNIVATYSGNATNAGSASAPLAQVVNAASAPTPTTTTLASSLNPSTAGTNVTFAATVVGTSPTGTVAFTDDGAAISGCGAVALSGSGDARTASCSFSIWIVRTHAMAAAYSGSATNLPSASAAIGQVVTTTAGPLPTNNVPGKQIRFSTPTQALAKRQQLTEFIWSTGLPTSTLPSVTTAVDGSVFAGDLAEINPSLVSQVSLIDANVSGFDFHSKSYLLRPSNATNGSHVVIVHQGHAGYDDRFAFGIEGTVNALLAEGFSVALMHMPLHGWNSDTTANIPGQGTLDYRSHEAIINTTGAPGGGVGFRIFLEPIVQNINYLQTLSNVSVVSMLGISGGGWETSMAAAIDPRIALSIPVAGSAPLYVRNSDPSSTGDVEQFYYPLYAEDIAADLTGGGVATWLEIYALGGYGTNRRQVIVTNEFDPCCFSRRYVDSFRDVLNAAVNALGEGAWSHHLDSTTVEHEISPSTVADVILPALLQVTNAGPAPTTTTLASSLNPSTAGTNVTFAATVVGTSPTGTVAFTDDGAAISGCGAVALSGSGNMRTAGCSTASLPAGTHNIVATYGGNATNAGSASAPLAQVVNATSTVTVWVNDAVPAGATTAGTNEGWSWVSANPTPYAGTLAHQSVLASGYHQHYFDAATATLAVGVGDTLFTYVYLDPVNPPSEVMLQWNDGTWEHRAYWGANLIVLGTDGTASRRYMGPLPAAGQWVRLEVPAAQVGLEGRVLDGMAFTLHDGRATWDYAGRAKGL